MEPYRLKQAERWAAKKAERKTRILKIAIRHAELFGFQWITRAAVAAEARTSVGSINSHFGTMVELKREVLRQAVARENLVIVAQGLAEGHEIARGAPEDLRERALSHIR